MKNNKLLIGIDLDIGLKLYTVPSKEISRLKKTYPNITFQFINTKKNPQINDSIDIYWGNRITLDIIDQCKELKWIHFGSVGVDRARTELISKRKILVSNSSKIMDSAIVTSIIQFITNYSRGYYICEKLRSINKLSRLNFDNYYENIVDLENQTCLIVGYGNVGRKVSQVCQALGMRVIGINQKGQIKKKSNLIIKPIKYLKQCLKKADYIVNLLPYKKNTENLFDKNLFNVMKPNSFFINVGRGETVDEAALYNALKRKKIAGAGLDVFKNEPLKANSQLLKLDNTLITPHIAGLSSNYWDKQASLFENNLKCFLYGKRKKMKNLVNMKKYL